MAAPTGEAGVQEDGAHGDVSRQYDDDDENYEQYINNDVFFNAPIRQDKDSDDDEEEIVDLTRLKCLPYGGKFIPQDYSFGGHDHETSPPNCDIGLTPSSNHFVNASTDADALKLPRDNESKIFQIEHTRGTQNEHQSDTNVKIDYKKAIYELLEQQLLGPDVMDCHGAVVCRTASGSSVRPKRLLVTPVSQERSYFLIDHVFFGPWRNTYGRCGFSFGCVTQFATLQGVLVSVTTKIAMFI